MSEVKGALLGIILAIAVFGIVYASIKTAMENASDTVANRIEETASTGTSAAVAYTLP